MTLPDAVMFLAECAKALDRNDPAHALSNGLAPLTVEEGNHLSAKIRMFLAEYMEGRK